MKCDCCNKTLSDYEATLRHAVTNQFLDTCVQCIKEIGIPFRGRPDLEKIPAYEEPLSEEDRGWADDLDDE